MLESKYTYRLERGDIMEMWLLIVVRRPAYLLVIAMITSFGL